MQSAYLQFGGLIIGFIIMTIVYVRIASQGKILAWFEENRISYPKMLKEDKIENCIWLGKAESTKREKYIIEKDKMTYTPWPGGFPSFMQVEVRTLKYVRGNPAPYDAKGKIDNGITAQYLALMSNVKMLEARFNDIKNQLGIKAGKAGKLDIFILLGIAIVLIVTIYGVYMQMQQIGVLRGIYDAIHGVSSGGK